MEFNKVSRKPSEIGKNDLDPTLDPLLNKGIWNLEKKDDHRDFSEKFNSLKEKEMHKKKPFAGPFSGAISGGNNVQQKAVSIDIFLLFLNFPLKDIFNI
jgi:hypothetical protein